MKDVKSIIIEGLQNDLDHMRKLVKIRDKYISTLEKVNESRAELINELLKAK